MSRARWIGIALLWIALLPVLGCGGDKAPDADGPAEQGEADPGAVDQAVDGQAVDGQAVDDQVAIAGTTGVAAQTGETPRVAGEIFQVYFPGRDGALHGEPHELPADLETDARIAALLEALLAGPEDPSLERPLPEGVTLGRVFLNDDGVVLLDLEADESVQLAMGSEREMLILASLVDTVTLNLEGAESVVLLWNGVQRSTFAGHYDTTRPLLPRPELIRSGAPPPRASKGD